MFLSDIRLNLNWNYSYTCSLKQTFSSLPFPDMNTKGFWQTHTIRRVWDLLCKCFPLAQRPELPLLYGTYKITASKLFLDSWWHGWAIATAKNWQLWKKNNHNNNNYNNNTTSITHETFKNDNDDDDDGNCIPQLNQSPTSIEIIALTETMIWS